MSAYDLLVVGRPSVDVVFADLEQWPELGNDIEAAGLGVCAGTSFNTPAAANRIFTLRSDPNPLTSVICPTPYSSCCTTCPAS